MFRPNPDNIEYTVRKRKDGNWEYVNPAGETRATGSFKDMLDRAEIAKTLDELLDPS